MNLSTGDEATAACLTGILLGDNVQDGQNEASGESWWNGLGKQSDRGILVKVDDEGTAINRPRKITEILLYAAVESNSPSLPTPPGSSSPNDGHPSSGVQAKAVKVFALPLSSSVIDRIKNSVNVVTPSSEDLEQPSPAYFLPNGWDQPKAVQSARQKRPSLSSLFDDATQKRRKFKGRGGESVAQAMANIDRSVPSNGFSIESNCDSQDQFPTKTNDKARKALSRSASMTLGAKSEQIRPTSQSGSFNSGRRSTLHRMESAISPRNSPVLSEPDDTYGNQNRAALAKIVMAGMRLYGLQQRKSRPGRSQVTEPSSHALSKADAEDEYKLVYHQTFKAAMFAFRNQFSAKLVPQETMRDVVDRFLDLFCTDPMPSAAFGDGNLPSFGSQGSDRLGVFDLPSDKKSSPVTVETWSLPKVSKGQ